MYGSQPLSHQPMALSWLYPAAVLTRVRTSTRNVRGAPTMASPSLHPSITRESRPEPKLTSAPKDQGYGAALRPERRALALFIGGAGDKKP